MYADNAGLFIFKCIWIWVKSDVKILAGEMNKHKRLLTIMNRNDIKR